MTLKHRIQEGTHLLTKKYEAKKHSLEYLFFEITGACNLNCLHCGSDCKKETGVELTTQSWLKIIDYLYRTFGNSVRIIITGGEPLLHPELTVITERLQKYGFKWGMVSNGISLTKKRLAQLQAHDIYSITISLDGTQEVHSHLRQSKQAFAKTTAALRNIAHSPITHKDVVTCVYPKNLRKLDQTAALLIELGITDWRLFRIFPSGRAAQNRELQLSFTQTQELVAWIASAKEKYLKQGLNINLSCEGWLPFETDRLVRDLPFFCRAGINIASVLKDGTITGCSNNHHTFAQGNVLADDFLTVWEKRFADFRSRKWIENTDCSQCKDVKKCEGGSIHLWELGKQKPNFCYAKDLS